MMAKIDLKEKRETEIMASKEMPKYRYPNLYLSDVKLPLSATNVGKTFKAVVTLKLTGYRENNSVKRNSMSYDFDIHDIEFSGKGIAEKNAGDKLSKVFGSK